jgi:hypothetical protein
MLAAVAVTARPRANRAEVIKVPDLFIISPSVILTDAAENTRERRDST